MSNYLTSPDRKRTVTSRRILVKILFPLLSLIVLASSVGIFNNHRNFQEAHAERNIPRWLICEAIPGNTFFRRTFMGPNDYDSDDPDMDEPPITLLYRVHNSFEFQFMLFSRASIAPNLSRVDFGLNSLLNIVRDDEINFTNINENILGRRLHQENPRLADNEGLEFNSGAAVNPFDRFGMAGLIWTGYAGEWHYVQIDACAGTQIDPMAGLFYQGRLPPRSGWDEVGDSDDIRTSHFQGPMTNMLRIFTIAFPNIIANGIFLIARTIVTVVLVLIGISMTNLVRTLGIEDMLIGTETSSGIFEQLQTGIFWPLLTLIFLLTAIYIAYYGLIKKETRKSINALVRSFVMLALSVVAFNFPTFFISLPNNIALTTQAIVMSSMNWGSTGGGGLCASNISDFANVINEANFNDADFEPTAFLAQVSAAANSSVGCQFWYSFLFRPWVQGQFGTEYFNLFAADATSPDGDTTFRPDFGHRTDEHGNQIPSYNVLENSEANQQMVGNASVPMGGGTWINNWAIFNIAVNTNAHSMVDGDGFMPLRMGAVNNDWFRIVDVLANYSEIESPVEHEEASGSGTFADALDGTTNIPAPCNVATGENCPLPYWNTWVGNNANERIGIAIASILVSLIGLAAPAFFAFMSAMFSIGTAILMSVAPLFLLFGCWADRGFEIFKGWLQLVINLTVKRIVFGLLLAISIAVTINILELTDTLGFWQGVILLIVFTMAIIKSREKIVSIFKVNFASFNMEGTASAVTQRALAPAKFAGRAAVGAGKTVVAGKVAGKVAVNRSAHLRKSKQEINAQLRAINRNPNLDSAGRKAAREALKPQQQALAKQSKELKKNASRQAMVAAMRGELQRTGNPVFQQTAQQLGMNDQAMQDSLQDNCPICFRPMDSSSGLYGQMNTGVIICKNCHDNQNYIGNGFGDRSTLIHWNPQNQASWDSKEFDTLLNNIEALKTTGQNSYVNPAGGVCGRGCTDSSHNHGLSQNDSAAIHDYALQMGAEVKGMISSNLTRDSKGQIPPQLLSYLDPKDLDKVLKRYEVTNTPEGKRRNQLELDKMMTDATAAFYEKEIWPLISAEVNKEGMQVPDTAVKSYFLRELQRQMRSAGTPAA